MISPRATHLLLRHFDALDQVVSSHLTRKRPWGEEALTGLLCDLLDAESQADENVSYPLDQLLDDLERSDEALSLQFRVQTHQYPKHIEHAVTQSDFGLIVSFRDDFEGTEASDAWLMQAKRCFPSFGNEYDVGSRFQSVDAAQHARMLALQEWAGRDFVRYFLYCPRPARLRPSVREALNHARSTALAQHIFDFTLGLELRDDLLSEAPTTAAGLFVADVEDAPKTLRETHAAIFESTRPFSWFLVEHLFPGHGGRRRARVDSIAPATPGPPSDAIDRLIRGDHRVLDEDMLPSKFKAKDLPPVLPVHTLEISVVYGLERPRREFAQRDR